MPYIGPPLEVALSELSGWSEEQKILQLIKTYRERYAALGYAENVRYPGIKEALENLQATGFRMGVCTSKYEKFAIKVLENFELTRFFEFVSGGDYNVRKHDQIAGLLQDGIIGESSLMIGDRSIDLLAAHSNGINAAGVLWGYGSREELESERPQFIFDTIKSMELALTGK